MSPEIKVCILTSGGLDSSLLLPYAVEENREVFPLYVHSGFLREAQEQEALEKILGLMSHPSLRPLQMIQASVVDYFPDHWGFHPEKTPGGADNSKGTYVPGRNLFLLTHACHYAFSKNLEEIWIGTLKNSIFTDAQPPFYQGMENLFFLSFGRQITIRTPFSHLSKMELIRSYPTFPYQHTLTCLRPYEGKHCGRCLKCAKRRRAFQEAAVPDPTDYVRS